MERKPIGGGWVLIQEGDRLIVRAGPAGHVIGVVLLLGVGSALAVGLALGLWALARGWREAANGDAAALVIGGLLGLFFIAIGVMLLVDGEVPCILDRQSGTMQGIGSFRRKVVCRLDEIRTNIEQYQARAGPFAMVTLYQVRLHPEVAVGGFSTPEAAEALAWEVCDWLRKG